MTQIRFAGRRSCALSAPDGTPRQTVRPEVYVHTLPPMARTLQRLGREPLVSDGGMGSLLQTAVVRARCAEEET